MLARAPSTHEEAFVSNGSRKSRQKRRFQFGSYFPSFTGQNLRKGRYSLLCTPDEYGCRTHFWRRLHQFVRSTIHVPLEKHIATLKSPPI
jgi:hypothetical protein